MPPTEDWLLPHPRHQEAATRILLAARELLVDAGPRRFTAEAVARRAGCSRATLYRTVGGKQALLRAVILDGATRVFATADRAAEGLAGEQRVVEAMLAALAAIREDRALLEWLIHRRAPGDDELLREAIDVAAEALEPAAGREQTVAAAWLVRVTLSLLAWPLPDPASEREVIAAFVAPAFAARPPDGWTGDQTVV